MVRDALEDRGLPERFLKSGCRAEDWKRSSCALGSNVDVRGVQAAAFSA